MKITVNGKDYEMHYSMRMYVIYENIMGKSVIFADLTNYTNLIVLFYSAVLTTLQWNKSDDNFTYDEFIDWIDGNDGEVILADFAGWFTKQVNNQTQLAQHIHDKEEGDGTSKNS